MPDAWEDPILARAAIPNPHCSECGQWGSWRSRPSDGMLISGIEHLPNCWVVTGVPKPKRKQPVQRQPHPGVTMLREAMKEGKS